VNSRLGWEAVANGLWYSPRRHAEEADDSWLLRTACIYGVTPNEMYAHLCGLNFEATYAYGSKHLQETAEGSPSFGVSTSTSYCDLGSYCPLCSARDLRSGEMPWFRRSWQRVWSTHCPIDGTPLFLWPYRDAAGCVFLPTWMAECHMLGLRTIRLSNESRSFILQLRLARKVRGWIRRGSPLALPWLQQIEQERLLLAQDRSTYALTGLSPLALRRVANDAITLLCNSFGGAQHCQASYLASFLGPRWLFETRFASGEVLPRHKARCTRSFRDPAQRRSLITLAMRLLTSFAADPHFDGEAQLVGAGETALSRAMHGCSQSAARWACERARTWPRLVSLGLREALRCDPNSWPLPDA
jgi:hypothetical protein